ncbi:MAG: ABC transporter ATP-binding protein [Ktedonobacteraceae bacterium]
MVKQQSSARGEQDTRFLVDVQNITFGYSDKPLLYDVSLYVQRGEMIGLLGPNGSGKTTLLRLVSGLLRPQSGKILLQGRDLQRWGRRGAAQRIAVVPQELHIPFAFTVEHMVSLGRTPFVKPFLGERTQHDQTVVEDALQAAGVAPFADRIFNELSGGERQRVMIAMALAQEPILLLLDEPTSHLDIKYQIETLELVQRLNRERGVTVIAAMHDLNLASRYFARLLLFQRGIVADAGPAEALEPGLLSRVYGVDVRVGILRGAKHLSVLPPDSEENDAHDMQPPRVHLISGGGSGEVMMRALADEHISFSIGALNIGDSDYTLALRLANHVIVEQPYAPISQQSLEQVRVSLTQVSRLIVCPTPIGFGNIALLREAVVAAQQGLPVVVLASTDTTGIPDDVIEMDDGLVQRTGMAARDYTGGEGVKLVGELLQTGAIVVDSVGEAIEYVKRSSIQRKR